MTTEKQLTTIYIVRHGETEHNVNKIVQGQPTDSPLTEQGERQAKERAEELKDIHFNAIFSSDLGRTIRTAEIIKLDRKLAINTAKLLREKFYGEYEGKTLNEYLQNNLEAFEKFKNLPEEEKRKFKIYDSIETEEELVPRFITKLREIAVTYSGKTVLVVSHGTAMRTFLIHLGYDTREALGSGSLANTAYIKLTSDGVDFFIEKVVGHQKPLMNHSL